MIVGAYDRSAYMPMPAPKSTKIYPIMWLLGGCYLDKGNIVIVIKPLK
jgi:hypothetical protein